MSTCPITSVNTTACVACTDVAETGGWKTLFELIPDCRPGDRVEIKNGGKDGASIFVTCDDDPGFVYFVEETPVKDFPGMFVETGMTLGPIVEIVNSIIGNNGANGEPTAITANVRINNSQE